MHAGMEHFYRIADRLDLTDSQEQQLDAIIDNARIKMREGDHFRAVMRALVTDLNPDDSDYEVKLHDPAERAAAAATEKTLFIGKVKKDVYALLTAEQQKELEKRMAGRMGKMNCKNK
ncbi:MAG: hypothetical protein CSB48_13580 [Proteobacteria bacterium]|nr:MAG: hypothetical protein CSB48_13580 [Pseudomonadota bacterium]PIE40499.1 MAG: hypothetical protein CSA51_00375 [Gammaproteobacteria bacterium]